MQQCGFFVLAAGGSTGFDSVLKCGSDPPDAGHLGRIVLQEGRNSISGAMLDELKKSIGDMRKIGWEGGSGGEEELEVRGAYVVLKFPIDTNTVLPLSLTTV